LREPWNKPTRPRFSKGSGVLYFVKVGVYNIQKKIMNKKYYAHSLEGKPPSEWQPLEDQFRNLVELERIFSITLTFIFLVKAIFRNSNQYHIE